MLVDKERFSENHAWSEMPQHWPAGLADRAEIEVAGQGPLEARLVDGGPPVDPAAGIPAAGIFRRRRRLLPEAKGLG